MHQVNKTKRVYLRLIYNELNKWWAVQSKLEEKMNELECRFEHSATYDEDMAIDDEEDRTWEEYYDAAFMIACLEEEVARIDSTQKRFWNRRIKKTKLKLDIKDNLFEYVLRVCSYPA